MAFVGRPEEGRVGLDHPSGDRVSIFFYEICQVHLGLSSMVLEDAHPNPGSPERASRAARRTTSGHVR